MSFQLRDYQQDLVDRIRESYRQRKKAPLAVLPTGGGKTACFSHIAQAAGAMGKDVFILVHRKELLIQSSRSLERLGVDHGLVHPAFNMSRAHTAQIASIQTLVRRTDHFKKPHLIIIDEAHHATSSTYRKILQAYPQAHILGVTATPCRTDGKGLGIHAGGIFDDLVEGPSVAYLMDEGYLTRAKVYAPDVGIDLSGAKKKMGDYDPSDLKRRFDKPSITGDVIEHFFQHCRNMQAVAFCHSIEETHKVADRFRAAGIRSGQVDGGMDDQLRVSTLQDLESGAIQIVTSKDLIGEGVDIPVCSAALLLRPTFSLSLFLQQCGRVLRPVYAPGYDLNTREGRLAAIAAGPKPYAVILDFVGNTLHHGFVDDEREWTLDGELRGRRGRSEGGQLVRVEQCEKCYFVYEPAQLTEPGCPGCGHVQKTKERKIAEREGELEELTRAQVEAARQRRLEEIGCNTIEEFMLLAQKRGYANPYKWAVKKREGRIARLARKGK